MVAAPETVERDETLIEGRSPLAGLVAANISPAVADEAGLPSTAKGVVALKVGAGPARRYFRPGDIILEVNGVEIELGCNLECGAGAGRRFLAHCGQSRGTRPEARRRRLMSNLFQAAGMGRDAPRPLADRLRPQKLSDVVGQDHIAGEAGVLTRMLAAGRIPSIILWGPPGTGKTTIARLLAGETGLAFEQISAIFSGVADLKKVFEQARIRREQGRGTLLFVDEIHRFNKSQQDSFLPVVEDGTIILVGATTENPSFELNGALLSRSQVLVLNRLDAAAMNALIGRAEMFERRPLPVDEAARAAMIAMADGDGRYFLNLRRRGLCGGSRGCRAAHARNPGDARSRSACRSTTRRPTATTI